MWATETKKAKEIERLSSCEGLNGIDLCPMHRTLALAHSNQQTQPYQLIVFVFIVHHDCIQKMSHQLGVNSCVGFQPRGLTGCRKLHRQHFPLALNIVEYLCIK